MTDCSVTVKNRQAVTRKVIKTLFLKNQLYSTKKQINSSNRVILHTYLTCRTIKKSIKNYYTQKSTNYYENAVFVI